MWAHGSLWGCVYLDQIRARCPQLSAKNLGALAKRSWWPPLKYKSHCEMTRNHVIEAFATRNLLGPATCLYLNFGDASANIYGNQSAYTPYLIIAC